MSLSVRYAAFADRNPKEFLEYLQKEWAKDEVWALHHPSERVGFKNIKVLCQTGERLPFSEAYMPLPMLIFIQERYMLNGEKFRFIKLDMTLPQSQGPSPWSFLKSEFGLKTKDDIDFYLGILLCIQQQNSTGIIEYPRRVLELYLRIHAKLKGSPNSLQKKINEKFQNNDLILSKSSWIKSSLCTLDKTTNIALYTAIFPPPVSWEATQGECADLKDFYQNTLKISNSVSWNSIISALQSVPNLPSTSWTNRLDYIFTALHTLVSQLSDETLEVMKLSFENNQHIGIVQDGSLTWHKLSACVWSPYVQIPGKVDLSQQYGKIEPLFTNLLGVKKYDFEAYHKLTTLPETELQNAHGIEGIKRLLRALNTSLPEHEELLDPTKILSRKLLPVFKRDLSVEFCSIDDRFFVADREYLRQQLLGRVKLLHLAPYNIWELQPLMQWTNLSSRYLSWNTFDETYLRNASPQALPNLVSPSQTRGLLRIAKHFKSPRASTLDSQQNLAQLMNQARFFETKGIFSTLTLVSLHDSKSVAVRNLPGHIHIEDDGSQLNIYLPHEVEDQQAYFSTEFPRRIVEWMMSDPATGDMGRVDEIAISLVKSVLLTKDILVDKVLDIEGVVGLYGADLGTEARSPSKNPASKKDDPTAPHSNTPNSSIQPTLPQPGTDLSKSIDGSDSLTSKVESLYISPESSPKASR